jgi:hypothetical protein
MFALTFVSGQSVAGGGREFTVRRPVKQLVALDDATGRYHFRTCARFSASAPTVLPAAATLLGYGSDPECAAAAKLREWQAVRIRQAPKLTTRTNVLFVGNSLTYFNDLPWLVEQLSRAADRARPIRAEFVGSGGATLRQHWERGDALERIYGEAWDYVILQEQSGRPILAPDETAEYAARFDKAIGESGAQMVLFTPWTTASNRNAQERVGRQFESIARLHRALLAPVGTAWQVAQQAPASIRLYDSGGNHPTLAGSYLAACVIYSTLRDRSCAGLPHAFVHTRASDPADRLSSADAIDLQQVAWRAVSAPPVTDRPLR